MKARDDAKPKKMGRPLTAHTEPLFLKVDPKLARSMEREAGRMGVSIRDVWRMAASTWVSLNQGVKR